MMLKLLLLLQMYHSARSDFITCYTNVEGTEETRCSFSEGFSTCYTTYDINGEVTGRGCSTTDRICQGEYTVQSRHIYGFMSSLGCQEKARVGHLYRGRDCENNQVEDTFERKCYCRYHWCNHKDYYYGDSHKWKSEPLLILTTLILSYVVFI